MVAKHLQSKEAFIAFLRSRGIEPDLRQEGRSLVFAVFPVQSQGIPGQLGALAAGLKDAYIDTMATHRFHSRIGQLTYCPYLSEVGPAPGHDFKLSHRPSERHVFATAVLDPATWRAASARRRRAMVVDGLIGCIERIRGDWISDEDRADLMGAFLCLG